MGPWRERAEELGGDEQQARRDHGDGVASGDGPASSDGLGVLIVEDHPLFRDGLRLLLEDEPGIDVVGVAATVTRPSPSSPPEKCSTSSPPACKTISSPAGPDWATNRGDETGPVKFAASVADPLPMAATSTTRKIIKLRYAGTCGPCGATLPVGTEAVWDKAARAASCLTCPGPSTAQPTLPWQSVSVAGSSARGEYERRQQKRERKLETKWGRFAGVAKALSEDPQSTRAWARGADYERRLADDLGRLLGDRAVFLHDRKVGRANIDHLVVARSGVWVVDAKNYNGRVEHRSAGGWLGPVTWRIYVDGRDRTKLATGLEWQVEAVRHALVGLDVPIHSALCFPFKCWGMFAKPFRHDGVLVTWSKKLAQTIDGPGELGPEQTEEVVARLDQALRPAT